MATYTDITTGVQSDTATGAITGTLDTSSLSGDYTVEAVFTLTAGTAIVAVEDTANATAFSDAVQVAVFHIKGATPSEGVTFSKKSYEIPGTRFGATNTKLRFNVLAITGSGTLTTHGMLIQ